MRWPLHYQILAATRLGAGLGLAFNPGSSQLADVRYQPGAAGGLVEVDPGEPPVRLLDVAVGADANLKGASTGAVTGRSVRFRFESDGVHAVYSRTYQVEDRSIPMISRLELGTPAELKNCLLYTSDAADE